jgi:CheY-like chemotaxis protein
MRKKILLADDSKTALMMERTLLANSAYDVVVARDGREAVKQALDEHPDLIILDVVMPRAAAARRHARDTRDHGHHARRRRRHGERL